ncbi:hypothetical protein [Pedobacter agri]|uniref:hypothetical protein n=1 Tax=Pedobacter agri TaxID=454586 RepID=UPI00277E20F7|nr:hypothetical protein [Pedobacter agri]MDQ1139352.1 hypothetical protein [Pedobacter agri]
MPILSLSSKDLQTYQKRLTQLAHTEDSFAVIKELHQRLTVNEAELKKLEFAVNLLQIQGNHDLQKDAVKKEHQKLKDIRQTIDDRILIVEQKLYLGIPDDLDEMEQLIAEQEAIVADQEKLNEDELSLLEKMSQIDVAFGKQLAEIDQSRSNRELPLNAKLESALQQVEAAQKQTELRSKMLSFLPILLVPIILDCIAYKIGINGSNPLIFSHYIFLISLIVIQIFFADQIRIKIFSFLAVKQCDLFFKQISDSLSELEKTKRQIETKHSIKAEDILSIDMS